MKLKSPFKDPFEAYGIAKERSNVLYSSHKAPEPEEVRKAMRFRRLLIGIPSAIGLGMVIWGLSLLGPVAYIVALWIIGGAGLLALAVWGVSTLIDKSIDHGNVLERAKKVGVKDV